MVLSFVNNPLFRQLNREDGLIEWLTVVGLVLAMVLCFWRVRVLFSSRPAVFLVITLLGGLVFLFGAGEEISWGQRLFNIQTPQWFEDNNRQGETNIHNMVVFGQDLTKLAFGKILTLLIFGYLLVLAPFYLRVASVSKVVDYLGIPVPQTRQIIAFVLMAAMIHLPDINGRESELFEFAGAFMFLVIIAWPRNQYIFNP